MDNSHKDPDLRRLRSWCNENDIPVSTAYEKIKEHGLKIVKVGRGSYLDRETRRLITSGEAA